MKISKQFSGFLLFFTFIITFQSQCLAGSAFLSDRKWDVGETWTLETYYATNNTASEWNGPYYWEYVVTEISTIVGAPNNKRYYVVNVNERTNVFDIAGTLWYDCDSFCLKKVEIKSGASAKKKTDRNIDYDKCTPICTTLSIIPFDTPVFPIEIGSEKQMTIEKNIGDGLTVVRKISQTIEPNENEEYGEIARVACMDGDSGELLFEQYWKGGMPWACYGENDNFKYKMVLE